MNKVRKKSPARRAGVRRGDVVTHLDGRPVETGRSFFEMLSSVTAGQQLSLRRGQAPGDLRAVSRETLARSSACADDSTYYSAAVRAERAILATAPPAVSAAHGEATGLPTTDLRQIVSADFPPHGLPLEELTTPSALITELTKCGEGASERPSSVYTIAPSSTVCPDPPYSSGMVSPSRSSSPSCFQNSSG